MKALEIDAPHSCVLTDRAAPRAGDGEVLLRVRRVGYCGSDLNTFRGLNPMVSYPRVPGHEIAATVEEVGGGVPDGIRAGGDVTVFPYTSCGRCTSCRWGRPNACRENQTLGVQRDGALTELLVVPHDKIVAAPGLSLAELALVEPLAVGCHAVDRGDVRGGETVVVIGAGMIGLGAIAAAGLTRQARVIAVDIDDAKLALARRAGAAEVINTKHQPLVERVAELTRGDGAAVVIEAVGTPDTFRAAVDAAAFAGRVVYIGYTKQPVAYETKYFVMKEIDIRGSRNATPADFAQTVALLQSGRYPAAETITRSVPLAHAADALRDWSSDPAKVTKIQVTL